MIAILGFVFLAAAVAYISLEYFGLIFGYRSWNPFNHWTEEETCRGNGGFNDEIMDWIDRTI